MLRVGVFTTDLTLHICLPVAMLYETGREKNDIIFFVD